MQVLDISRCHLTEDGLDDFQQILTTTNQTLEVLRVEENFISPIKLAQFEEFMLQREIRPPGETLDKIERWRKERMDKFV